MNAKPTISKRRIMQISGQVALGLGVLLGAAGWAFDLRRVLWFGGVAVLTGAAWLVCSRFTSDEPMRPAQRRYLRDFFPAIIAYMLIVIFGWSQIASIDSILLKWVLALLPVVPIMLILRAMLRLLRASDELQQQMQLQAIAIAAMGVGLASFAAAFLVAAELLPVDNLLMLVLPAMIGTYGLALAWIKRKYRGQ